MKSLLSVLTLGLILAHASAQAHAGHDHGPAADVARGKSAGTASASGAAGSASAAGAASTRAPGSWEAASPRVPDVQVRDQHGKLLRFHSDLVKGRKVAVNFIFTSCTSVCSPMTATFRAVQQELKARKRDDVHLISVSVDPLTDTPETLSAFGRKFGAEPGWTFVTGSRKAIDEILKAYGIGTGDPDDHAPLVYISDDSGRQWTRSSGLAAPQAIVERLLGAAAAAQKAAAPKAAEPKAAEPKKAESPAALQRVSAASSTEATKRQKLGAEWFTNLPVRTQSGQTVRFYDDLLKDRIVVLNSFFASCKEVCSPMTHNLAKVQQQLGEQAARDVHIVSVTVDPKNDTPDVLKAYASRHTVRPGWTFVTGKPENVDWVLHKLGLYEENRDEHTAILWVGNERTGLWMKMHAMSPPSAIINAIRKAQQDRGA
jgi:protein SCO1/2